MRINQSFSDARKFKSPLTGSREKKMTPVTETDYRRNCPNQNIYCQCRKLAFKKHIFLQSQIPALTTSFGVDSTACSSNSAISSDWRHFFVPEPVSGDLNFRASEISALVRMRVRVNPVGIPVKLSRVCQLGPCLYVPVHIP